MGRTVRTSTMLMDQMQGLFSRFVKSATPNEQRLISKMFARARNHLSAISMSNHLLPFETILLAMQHEQQKQINELKERLPRKLR